MLNEYYFLTVMQLSLCNNQKYITSCIIENIIIKENLNSFLVKFQHMVYRPTQKKKLKKIYKNLSSDFPYNPQ